MENKDEMIDKVEELLLDNDLEGAAYFTGDDFDTAIAGYTDNNQIIYSYDKMVEWYMDKYDVDDVTAMEWIDYNTIRAIPYMGPTQPIIMYSLIT